MSWIHLVYNNNKSTKIIPKAIHRKPARVLLRPVDDQMINIFDYIHIPPSLNKDFIHKLSMIQQFVGLENNFTI